MDINENNLSNEEREHLHDAFRFSIDDLPEPYSMPVHRRRWLKKNSPERPSKGARA